MPKKRKAKLPLRPTELDAELYVAMFARTREAVRSALGRYGAPVMSLEELRRAIRDACRGMSLSAAVLKEREAGW